MEAMFAAVYAGCFYTVIDIDSPINRITEIFKTLKPQAVITDLAHLELAGRVYKGNTITVYEQAITGSRRPPVHKRRQGSYG